MPTLVSTAPHWAADRMWEVPPNPTLAVGELEGPPELTFGNARDAGRLPDGRYYVGDEQAHTIRVFSRDGEFLQSAGREGDGPGELRWFLTVKPYRGDSLWVYDYSHRRVSIFGPDFEFARSFPNPLSVLDNYWITAAMEDGQFLAYSAGTTPRGASPGPYPDSSRIIVLAADGTSADTVGGFKLRTLQIGPDGRPSPSHLQATAVVAAKGRRLVLIDPSNFEMREFDLNGDLRRVFKKAHVPVPVTEELLAEYRGWYTDRAGGHNGAPPEGLERRLREAHYPEYLPATSYEVFIDAMDHTWVARYHFPGDVATSWEVFDPAGIWLGSVETPSGFEVKQILEDEIVGVWTDEFDVAYLHSYSLDRR
ncbi:MAG: hypothetical protein KJO44_09175 [Gemmatimonadetes bacterium]|nr:hypothetical protein [Gemmatimonadota bacterium]